jgi:hypothetical protein
MGPHRLGRVSEHRIRERDNGECHEATVLVDQHVMLGSNPGNQNRQTHPHLSKSKAQVFRLSPSEAYMMMYVELDQQWNSQSLLSVTRL